MTETGGRFVPAKITLCVAQRAWKQGIQRGEEVVQEQTQIIVVLVE